MGTRHVITPVFRASYQYLLEPRHNEQSNTYSYSVTMILPPEVVDDPLFQDMQAIIQEAIQERWKGNPPKTGVKTPIRFGEWKTQTNPGGFDLDKNPEYEGNYIIYASGYTKQLSDGTFDRSTKVGIVGADPQMIFNPQQDPIYSGMYGKAEISAYVPKFKPGVPDQVCFGLHNFQKCYDGEPLSGGNGRPEDAFEAFVAPTGVGANSDLLGI
jgi:hypothetical protein